MLIPSKHQYGVSLIELIIGIGITTILLAVAIPSFITWINSTKIRTAAESITNALQLSRAEAVRRNTIIRFVLTDTSSSWTYGCFTANASCPATIESRTSSNENTNNVTVSSTQTGIAFNSLGRQNSTTNLNGSATASPATNVTINVTNPSAGACMAIGGDIRCMRITISSAGQIRMCDPALPSTNLRGC